MGIILLVSITIIQYFAGKRAAHLQESGRVANSVVHELSSLLFIVEEYEDQHNLRFFRNWQQRFEDLSESLSKYPALYHQIEDDLNLIDTLINELYAIQDDPSVAALSAEQREVRSRKRRLINNRSTVAIRSILSKSIRHSKEVSLQQRKNLRHSYYLQISLIIILVSLFILVFFQFLNNLSKSFKLLSQKINLTPAEAIGYDDPKPTGHFPYREFDYILENFHNLMNRIKQVNRTLENNRQELEIAVDRERMSIASELHDNITQVLGMAKMQLNNLGLENSAIHGNHRFQKTTALLHQATEDIRNLTHQIIPKSIKDFGVVISVEEFLSEVENSSELKTKINYNTDIRLQDDIELNVYRIIQEAVNNVVKHANATQVLVNLQFDTSYLHIRIIDDGIGFSNSEYFYGIGLRTMQTRSKRIHAKLNIYSSEKGSTIDLSVPIT